MRSGLERLPFPFGDVERDRCACVLEVTRSRRRALVFRQGVEQIFCPRDEVYGETVPVELFVIEHRACYRPVPRGVAVVEHEHEYEHEYDRITSRLQRLPLSERHCP